MGCFQSQSSYPASRTTSPPPRYTPRYTPPPKPSPPRRQYTASSPARSTNSMALRLAQSGRARGGGAARSLLKGVVMQVGGYEFGTPTNRIAMCAALRAVRPSGCTALYDSLAMGILHQLKFFSTVLQLGGMKHKFLHVVLTDGEDTSSKLSLSEVGVLMGKCQSLGDLCTTVFIGVELGYSARSALQSLARLGGPNASFKETSDTGIEQIFAEVSLELSVRSQVLGVRAGNQMLLARRQQAGIGLAVNYYAVLFTLDVSGSMNGRRWSAVVNAVDKFMAKLSSEDLFAVVLFNDTPKMITGN